MLFCITSCHRPKPEDYYDCTVLAYIAAENSLSSWYKADINEMMKAAGDIPLNSRLIIYLDDTQLPRLLSIEKPQEGDPILKTLHQYTAELDSADPETLHKVMEWTTKNYPALSYGLILWSHGEAWIPAHTRPIQRSICIDNNQNTSSDRGSKMDISDIADVLSTFPKFEFILFDACFMQAVEVAYELRHVTKSIIASPAEIPGPGAPYHRILKPMFATPTNATQIAKEYFQAYNDNDKDKELQHYGILLSVIDCAYLEEFAATTAEIITKYVSKETSIALNDIQRYCPAPNKLRPSYYDMNDYMLHLITEEADYTRWKYALDKAVSYAAATPWWFSIYSDSGSEYVNLEAYCGLSCYIPQHNSINLELNAMFQSTSWYHAAGWEQIGW